MLMSLSIGLACFVPPTVALFAAPRPTSQSLVRRPLAANLDHQNVDPVRSIQKVSSRKTFFLQTMMALGPFLASSPALADFAPGGTLVDYTVGVQVGNPQASASRKADNTNVLFVQDYYFKFGTAPSFIQDDSFPKSTPFVPAQQRYDAMKKYRNRVERGVQLILSIADQLDKDRPDILDENSPEYSIRPMGLLANSFFASENTGTTNELFLARWYINELVLDIGDVRRALSSADGSNKQVAKERYAALVEALRSYLQLMNRQVSAKVGDKFIVPAAYQI